ncbi:OmpA/MotB family protein [Sulfitobacter sabulilitoris]|uniref:Chemotaxis protein MotB n=1 Tax=Sulfitobacter sabulilitoris TaxID=2562655 RepID=A0A5S3PEL0_9RHOB|nr:flagellar motor protein MotB [Sulfitobacter sabulilitoris]TMM52484.1 chemotaxis protein MotB [Sulfitobacter sabulilitoris]
MGAQANAAPVIIKRKKVVGGGGHHGGAWKVAYADFVTAMMAFFMLMWLLNATTEQQRKGLADYFSPTIPINRISGGGDGAFGGDSIFSENVLPKVGTGATAQKPSPSKASRGASGLIADGTENDGTDAALRSIEDALSAYGGESMVMDDLMRHVVTRITDEGLVIELFALDGLPLFEGTTAQPTPLLRDLGTLVASVSQTVTNGVAIGGHVRANAIVRADNPVWDLSSQRATAVRALLEGLSVAPERMQRVTGHADREPVLLNTMATRNDRIEIILLR